MELNLTHSYICVNEAVYSGVLEQSIELDYLLPDYCPSIFKVLKCKMNPKIHSRRVSGNKLIVDGTAVINIIYVTEGDNNLHSIEQKMPFSKTVELRSECENPIMSIKPKTSYVNCRVVNNKRLDIRGAVNMEILVNEQKDEKMISEAENSGIQLKKSLIKIGNKHKCGSKQFTIKEELSAGTHNAAISSILYSKAHPVVTDYKIMSNKIVLKGEILLHTLFSLSGENKPIWVEHSIPVSQIIDVNGAEEGDECVINLDIISNEIDSNQNIEEETDTILVDISICAYCECFKNEEMQITQDAYSVKYETDLSIKNLKSYCLFSNISHTAEIKEKLSVDNSENIEIYDIICENLNTGTKIKDKKLIITGDLNIWTIYKNEIKEDGKDEIPAVLEKIIPYELETPYEGIETDNINSEISVFDMSCRHTLSGNEIELKIELKAEGVVYLLSSISVVSDITILNEKEKNSNESAITVYYADNGENVWEIAKRYNTSVQEIINENNLEGETLCEREMVLIPIID